MPNNRYSLNDESDAANYVVVFSLIFLHLLIVVPLGYLVNIWTDEGSTLYTTGFGVSHALQNALADEKQAPLYFWALSLWREADHSIFFARAFSMVCSCVSIKIFYDLARRVLYDKNAFYAAAFFAVHPYLIWASLEIRVYAAVILLSVWFLKLFDNLYFKEDLRRRRSFSARRFNFSYVWLTLAAIIALYTNYYLGFLLVGCFAALIITGKWRETLSYAAQMFVAGLAFLPLVLTIKNQFAANTGGYQEEQSIGEALRILWNLLLNFILPTEIFPDDTSSYLSLFRLWLVRAAIAAVVFLLIKNRRLLDQATLVYGTISAVIILFLLAAYYLIGGDYVSARHAAVLFAPFVLLIALLCQELFKSNYETAKSQTVRGLFGLSMAVLCLIFFVYAVFALYPNFAKRGDWQRVAGFVEQNEKPNQPVVVFTVFDALALIPNYHGVNQILPDEKYFDFGLEAEAGSAESLKKQTEFAISKIPPDAPEIWLLTDDKCSIKDSCAPLENFIAANYTIIEQKEFYEETVRLLRKK